jgi:hypothetical protein
MTRLPWFCGTYSRSASIHDPVEAVHRDVVGRQRLVGVPILANADVETLVRLTAPAIQSVLT